MSFQMSLSSRKICLALNGWCKDELDSEAGGVWNAIHKSTSDIGTGFFTLFFLPPPPSPATQPTECPWPWFFLRNTPSSSLPSVSSSLTTFSAPSTLFFHPLSAIPSPQYAALYQTFGSRHTCCVFDNAKRFTHCLKSTVPLFASVPTKSCLMISPPH